MKRTEEELRKVAVHVDYEVWMMEEMAPLQGGSSPADPATDNAYLESFVIHVRNLIYFLHPEGKKKPGEDDILAVHFIGESSNWRNSRPEISQCLINAYTRVNKLAAHLTYSRMTLPKNWKPSRIYADLWVSLQWFLAELHEDRRKWFPNIVKGPQSKGLDL